VKRWQKMNSSIEVGVIVLLHDLLHKQAGFQCYLHGIFAFWQDRHKSSAYALGFGNSEKRSEFYTTADFSLSIKLRTSVRYAVSPFTTTNRDGWLLSNKTIGKRDASFITGKGNSRQRKMCAEQTDHVSKRVTDKHNSCTSVILLYQVLVCSLNV
jgi:hypothetical protein